MIRYVITNLQVTLLALKGKLEQPEFMDVLEDSAYILIVERSVDSDSKKDKGQNSLWQ